MTRQFRHLGVTTAVIALGLAGCTTTATIDSSRDLAKASNGADGVAFGKFRLVRNGHEAQLGNGIFSSGVRLYIESEVGDDKLIGRVGDNGEFAWALRPGSYRISAIEFDNRGAGATTDSNFTFVVPENRKAVYIGTITLNASVEWGYYGTRGTIDDYKVDNDCASDCARRLEALGLSEKAMTVGLVDEQFQLAQSN